MPTTSGRVSSPISETRPDGAHHRGVLCRPAAARRVSLVDAAVAPRFQAPRPRRLVRGKGRLVQLVYRPFDVENQRRLLAGRRGVARDVVALWSRRSLVL